MCSGLQVYCSTQNCQPNKKTPQQSVVIMGIISDVIMGQQSHINGHHFIRNNDRYKNNNISKVEFRKNKIPQFSKIKL